MTTTLVLSANDINIYGTVVISDNRGLFCFNQSINTESAYTETWPALYK